MRYLQRSQRLWKTTQAFAAFLEAVQDAGPARVAVQTHATGLKNHNAALLAFKIPQDAAGVDGELDHDICVFIVGNVDMLCRHSQNRF